MGNSKLFFKGTHRLNGVWVGPAYRFPEYITPPTNVVQLSCENVGLLKGDFTEMVSELNSSLPYLAIVENAQVVSVCRSVRLSSLAHEAGVDTRGWLSSAWVCKVCSRCLGSCYSRSESNSSL